MQFNFFHYLKILVHIIHAGPLNEVGQYSFTILSTNCNYPLYVFARDPVIYKQVTNILYLNNCKAISFEKKIAILKNIVPQST